MSKKNPNVKKKSKGKIPWDKMQNDPKEYDYIRKMLKIIKRYDGIGIAELVSRSKKSQIVKDYMNLGAMNVYLGILTGKAEGDFLKANHKRKSELAKAEVDVRVNGMDDEEDEGKIKVTDKLAIAEAENRCIKYRKLEAKALEKQKVFENTLHRTNKLLEILENVHKNLDTEYRRTK